MLIEGRQDSTMHEYNASQREDDAVFLSALRRSRDYILISPVLDNPFIGRINQSKRVIASVARAYGMEADEIIGEGRTRRHCKIRFIIYRLLTDCGFSSTKVGRAVGDRDHSTVLSGLRQFEVHYERDEFFAAVYNRHCEAMSLATKALVVDLAA